MNNFPFKYDPITEVDQSKIPTPKEILDNIDNFAQTINLMNEQDMSFELASSIIKNKLKPALTTHLQDYLEPEGFEETIQKLENIVRDYLDKLPRRKPYNVEVTKGDDEYTCNIRIEMEINDPEERQRLLDAGWKEV